jgi:CubicO group peptidase (beta-lactamase class C family)/predicted secreted Zn-dependent protease
MQEANKVFSPGPVDFVLLAVFVLRRSRVARMLFLIFALGAAALRWSARPPTARGARVRRLTALAGLVVLFVADTPGRASAQDFDAGRFVPGVRVGVGVDPYDITGATAVQILRQLEISGQRPWVRYPAQFTWSYDAEVIPRLNGTPSDQCRFTEFEIVLDFTAIYPRWTPPADATPELLEAWAAFQDQMQQQWERHRDEYLARATEAMRRSRRHEDHCPLLMQRFHTVVLELMDRSRPLAGHTTAEPLRLTWPPAGHEGLLNPASERSTDPAPPPATESVAPSADDPAPSPAAATPGVAVRPGVPRPLTTPAADLDFAVQTDLRGTLPTGFVAGLYHQGQLQYFNAFGTHPATGDSLTIDTPLPVPAFTEVLVSTLAVALDRAGILALDAPISTYLGDVSTRLGRVTTRQLLEHRAGLDNAPPLNASTAWDRVLDRLNDRALVTDPGVIPSYSMYSFALAARVIERTTDATLEDAIGRTLLAPLGMASTSFGARDEEGVVGGVPIAYTSAADLLRFWYAWLDGSIAGAGVDLVPAAEAVTLSPDGRAFQGGLWVDRPGAVPRLSLACGTDLANVLVEVFPVTNTIVLAIGLDGWPRHTGTYLLEAAGRALRLGNEVFGPVRLAGVAGFGRRARACDDIATSQAYRPVDFGPRAEAEDWVGRYVNGDWFFALEEQDGLLVSPRPEGTPWDIHHFEGDTYFAGIRPEGSDSIGFPFRLFRGPDGRRYLMLGDRAYQHEADRVVR